MRAAAALLLTSLGYPATVVAQVTDTAQRLPDRTVTVTRGRDSLARLGASVTVLSGSAISRGRLATGLDEALAFVPGVIVGNRWNYSVDQRLSIRGFGARANFGLRGVKVLVDGVPQTLPDGQSQLTNLDLALVDRVEVLRGAASALHGNAAGGVLAFHTRVVPLAPLEVVARTELGTFGTSRVQVIGSARSGSVGGTVAASRFATVGSRMHAEAEQRRLTAAIDWALPGAKVVTFRAAMADDPTAQNPGALTGAELALRPDSAAAGNILRNADKVVSQRQLAVAVRHDAPTSGWDVTVYGLTRDLENPLATPPPQPTGPAEGTYVAIDRVSGGVRASARASLGGGPRPVALSGGLDAQAMRDNRMNSRAVGGVPTGAVLVEQRETVRELGTFAQLSIPLRAHLTARAGIRHDFVRFDVLDEKRDDGDASGHRTMAATSGHVALALTPAPGFTAWTSVASSFETPTTTELANRIEGDGGFNTSLDPQRSVSVEVGARWSRGALSLEAAGYRTATADALIAFRENAGRTYFQNAGRTRTWGAEFAAGFELRDGLRLQGTWTRTNATFIEYQLTEGATVTDLKGNRLAGIPQDVARIGVQGTLGRGISIDVDHAWSSGMYADDRNTIPVDGWGAGVSSARILMAGTTTHYRLAPFVAVTNVFNREYVGSVTINGGFGRVFEPSAGRAVFVGIEAARR